MVIFSQEIMFIPSPRVPRPARPAVPRICSQPSLVYGCAASSLCESWPKLAMSPCSPVPSRLIVLLLIRKSITSLRKHIERVTERLPVYHDEEDTCTSPPQSPASTLQHTETMVLSQQVSATLFIQHFNVRIYGILLPQCLHI